MPDSTLEYQYQTVVIDSEGQAQWVRPQECPDRNLPRVCAASVSASSMSEPPAMAEVVVTDSDASKVECYTDSLSEQLRREVRRRYNRSAQQYQSATGQQALQSAQQQAMQAAAEEAVRYQRFPPEPLGITDLLGLSGIFK